MLLRNTFCIFSFIVLIAVKGYTQQTVTIYGKIVNKSGVPLIGVNISLQNTSTKSTSNNTGDFELTVPASSIITLLFSHISFGLDTRTITSQTETRQKIDFTFSDAVKLDTFTITDNQTRPDFIQQIPVKTLYAQASASQDFNAILFSQPGVSSSNELSSGYSVRGGNYDENLVYVNDIEVYRPFLAHSGQQEGLSFVNSDMVSNILFSTGGFEAKYGDKMSSVLDIQYRRPREFNGTVAASLLGGAVHLENASENKRLTWILGARQKSSQYVLNGLDTKGDYRPSFYDVQAFLTYDLTDEWEIDVLGNIASNKFVVIPESRQTDFGTIQQALRLNVFFAGREIDAFRSGMGAVSFINRPANKNITLKYIASAYQTNENETFDIIGAYSLERLEADLGKDNFGQVVENLGVGAFTRHARNYLTANIYNIEHKGNKIIENKSATNIYQTYDWGVKLQHEEVNDQISEWRWIDSAGYSVPVNNGKLLQLAEVLKTKINLTSNRVSGYLQSSFSKVTKKSATLKLTFGLRANYWNINQQTVISPRAAFSYKPNWKKDFLFKIASGFYYQPPFYRELRNFEGQLNKNLKAQQSIHFVAGSDFNFKAWSRPFKFTTEIYYKSLNNLVPYKIDDVRIRYYATNNSQGYATGIDFKINGEFVKGIESWFSMSFLQTRENLTDDSYAVNYNKSGENINKGLTTDKKIAYTVTHYPGSIPRPTDQLVNFSLFFQDYIPKVPHCKMHMNLLFGSGLPFGPPGKFRYKDTLRNTQYRRVDIGFSYELIKEKEGEEGELKNRKKIWNYVKSLWLSAEVYNLTATYNTISHTWIQDIYGRQYAIPNYLTRRLLNVRLICKF